MVEYKPSSDTAIIADHIIAREGITALKRMIKTWKNKDYSKLQSHWQAAVDTLYTVAEQKEYKDLYIMGYADILPPILEPWCDRFFEWVITEPRLMYEYLELEAEGGHLLSTSNAMHSGISAENAPAYVEAAHEHGVYPINID